MLTFDAEACIRALIQKLIQVSDSLMNEFYRDATAMLSAQGKNDSEQIKATYDAGKEMIEAKCNFYVQAILESFGVGFNADRSEKSYWDEYSDTSKNPDFNLARKSNRIVGRPAGPYTDIWGKPRDSTGRNEGKDLHTFHLLDTRTGKYHQVWPSNQESWTTKPTYSIQRAEDWIIRNTETKVERRIQMEIEKFLSEEGTRFFIEIN